MSNKILDGLVTQFEELEQAWQEARKSVTPRRQSVADPSLSTSTSNAPQQRQKSFSETNANSSKNAPSAVSAKREQKTISPQRSISPSSKGRHSTATGRPQNDEGKERGRTGISPSRPLASNNNNSNSNSNALTRTSPARGSSPSRLARDSSDSKVLKFQTVPMHAPKTFDSSEPLSTSAQKCRPISPIPAPSSAAPPPSVAVSGDAPTAAAVPEVPFTQKFCHHCGFDLRACKVPPKFCRECGSRLNTPSVPPVGS